MFKNCLTALAIIILFSFCGNQPDEASTSNWELLAFVKADNANPVLEPDSGRFFCPVRNEEVDWELKDVFNPAAVVRDGKIMLIYRAEDTVGIHAGTSRLGLAESADGMNFTRRKEPVFFPDNDQWKKYEWEGGCEDPRLVETDTGYIMTYTAYDGKTARLMIASSKDLLQWTKHGPAFKDVPDDPYTDKWSKSGAIVARYNNDGSIRATRINGKYWMYWGDVNIMAASSDDLIRWTPVEYSDSSQYPRQFHRNSEEHKAVKIVIAPRTDRFDSDLVEPGPAAMLTDKGILLLYNSRNLASGDKSLPEGSYTVAQALLDKNDPTKLIARSENYFMRPDKPFEIDGQVDQVCFAEGLVYFRGQWFLYYGTADSKIGVTVSNSPNPNQ